MFGNKTVELTVVLHSEGENPGMHELRITQRTGLRKASLALATVATFTLGLAALRSSAAPTVGKPAPAFAAPTVDTGKRVSLAGYKGKSAVLLNFYSNT